MCLNVTCMLQSALEARAELLGVYSVYSRLVGLFASNFLLWVLRIELRSLCLHDKWFYPISLALVHHLLKTIYFCGLCVYRCM